MVSQEPRGIPRQLDTVQPCVPSLYRRLCFWFRRQHVRTLRLTQSHHFPAGTASPAEIAYGDSLLRSWPGVPGSNCKIGQHNLSPLDRFRTPVGFLGDILVSVIPVFSKTAFLSENGTLPAFSLRVLSIKAMLPMRLTWLFAHLRRCASKGLTSLWHDVLEGDLLLAGIDDHPPAAGPRCWASSTRR